MKIFHLCLKLLFVFAIFSNPSYGQDARETYGYHLLDSEGSPNKDLLKLEIQALSNSSFANRNLIWQRSDSIQSPRGADLSPRQLPLTDAVGQEIAVLNFTWAPSSKENVRSELELSDQIRNNISRHVLNVANLYDRFPYSNITEPDEVKALVNSILNTHSEIKIVAIRGYLANSKELILLGSSFGRVGKKADEDDLKVLSTNSINVALFANNTRMGIDFQLKNVDNQVIGTINLGVKNDPTLTKVKTLDLANQVQLELKNTIGHKLFF